MPDEPLIATEEQVDAPEEQVEEASPETPPEAPVDNQATVQQLRSQLSQYQAQNAQTQAESLLKQITDEANQKAQQLEEEGIPSDRATSIAREIMESRQRELATEVQSQQQALLMQGKMNAAVHYGNMYGVSPGELVRFNSPQEMEDFARGGSEITQLKREVDNLKKGRVPSQTFDSGQGGSSGTEDDDRFMASYSRGDSNDHSRAQKILEQLRA